MSNFDSASFLDEAKTTGSETSHPAVSVLAKFCLPSTLRQCIQVLYMDATNTLLIRDVDGNVVLLDGCLENAHPLLNAQLKTDANLFYDRQNGTIVAIDDTKLCMRRDYAGTFLLKTILSPANDGQVSVELPVEEALKFVQLTVNEEGIMSRRPVLSSFVAQLKNAIPLVAHSSQETIVLEVEGTALLSDLRPMEPQNENSTDVPVEWLSPLWSPISALAERLRLLLSPKRPYNFDYAPEWKGMDKEIMVSEAARMMTFERWPHMNYRWALPYQMAEAGFYHQPNKAGDDRVLCFTCLVCLVSWEPSDEPWSEHERHSPSCRFIRNNANPNVPLSLTMSSLSPILHGMSAHCPSPIVVSNTSHCDWLAVTYESSSNIHLWHLDRVVQSPYSFRIDMNDTFIAMKTGFVGLEDFKRPQRVTWSDDTLEPSAVENKMECDCHGIVDGLKQNEPQPPIDNVYISQAVTASLGADSSVLTTSSDLIKITAICTVGRPCLVERSAIDPTICTSSLVNRPSVVVGVSIDDSKLIRTKGFRHCEQNLSEINALNSVNAVCTAESTPRIVPKSRQSRLCEGKGDRAVYRPFILVYQLDETAGDGTVSVVNSCDRSRGGKRRRSESSSKWTVGDNEMVPPVLEKIEGETTIDLRQVQNSELEDGDMAEDILLIEGEADSDVNEWVNEADPDQSTFSSIDAQLAAAEAWSVKPPVKNAERNTPEFIPIAYEPPKISSILVQCFRLPPELDETGFKISCISPTQNGVNLVVVVNKESDEEKSQSAIAVYRLNFTDFVTSVQELPVKIYTYDSMGIEQLLMMNTDLMNTGRILPVCSTAPDILESAVIRSSNGTVLLIDLNTNESVKLCDENAIDLTLMESGKCAVLTDEGYLSIIQVEQYPRRFADEDDDEVAVAALISRHPNENSVIAGNLETSSGSGQDTLQFGMSSLNFLVMQPITTASLYKMWELTRSDGNSCISSSSAVFRTGVLPNFSGGSAGFSVIPPVGWSEKQIHQKFRKIPQISPRPERSTRSWRLTSEGGSCVGVHPFELHVQAGIRISHLNVRVSFHASCIGCPDIQVTVFRRRPAAPENLGHDIPERPLNAIGTRLRIDISELQNQCDVVAGPFRLADYLEMNGTSALIQLAGRVFASSSALTQNTSSKLHSRTQAYYLVLEATSDVSLDQLVWAQKMREREKVQKLATGVKKSRRREAPSLVESKLIKKPSGSVSDRSGWPSGSSLSASSISRHGIEWVEEISISLFRARRVPGVKERVQCRLMLHTVSYHSDLVRVAAGLPSVKVEYKLPRTNGERSLHQHQSLDILAWLLDNWNVPANSIYLNDVANVIQENIDAIINNGFVFASRSISHKWCSLIIHILRNLKLLASPPELYASVLHAVLNSIDRVIPNLHSVRTSGSLHWLLTLTFAALQAATALSGQSKCTQAVSRLLLSCANTVTIIGTSWKQIWRDVICEKLADKYSLKGFPFELIMYDWPSPMLSLWPRAQSPSSSAAQSSAFITCNTGGSVPLGPIFSQIKNQYSTPPFSQAGPATVQGGIKSLSGSRSAGTQKDQCAVSSFMNGMMAQDEIDWLEFFNVISADEENSTACTSEGFLPPPGTGFVGRYHGTGFEASLAREGKRRVQLGSAHLCGLLEVEPLSFSCTAASDNIKVENMDTGYISSVAAASLSSNHGVSNGPVILRTAKSSIQTDAALALEQMSMTNVSMNDLCANLEFLNDHMKWLALEQSRGASTASHGDHQGGSVTQGSSASTFGVPTTPKTTPFMTPTPLSPSPLSPINSETNLTSLAGDSHQEMNNEEPRMLITGTSEGNTKNHSKCASNCHSNLPTAITVVPSDLLRPPPIQVLAIERMAAGTKKFVVLDFGFPVLLTDVLIPSCADLSSITIDVWLIGENIDGQRLTTSGTIGFKSIVLKDLSPTMLIRFLKLTYVSRQIFNAPCRVPIGSFFGHRFFSPWQLYACQGSSLLGIGQLTSYASPSIAQQHQPISLVQLRQLCEDLRCRHQLASTELKHLVREDAEERDVKLAYRECLQLKAQWNIVRGVVQRLESDQSLPVQVISDVLCVSESKWNDCSPDQLRCVAEQLLALLTRSAHLLDLRAIAAQTMVHTLDTISSKPYWFDALKDGQLYELKEAVMTSPTVEEVTNVPLLTLDTAVEHFTLFCTQPMPKLRVDCAAWLFHHANHTVWWAKFFPHVLKQLFTSPKKNSDHKVFLLLSYLCDQTVKEPSYQSGTVLELLKFLDELLAKTRDSIHGEFDVTLFCWTLLLTSSAFDVIICNKRKVDRWSFLAGEYTQSSQSEKFMDIGSRLSRKYGVASNPLISKYVYSNSKNGGEQDVHLSSIQQKTAAAKAHLESLWEDHVQVIEAMKASIKMKQLLEEKAQSVHEMLATKKKQAESEFTKKVVSTIQEKTVNDSEKEDISAFFDSNVNVSTGTDTAKDSSDMVMSKFPKSSSRGKSGSSKRCRPLRSRQLSVRLKLPMNICLSVARGLLTLLCKSSTKLPMIARLIACKLASRICAHASCSTIPLITVLKDNTESLLKLGICEQNSHWIRHAVLCLCLDVIESETRTVAKSSHMTINTNDEMKAGFVPDEGDLENLCAKLTKDAASLKHIESLAAKRFVGEADIEARQSTGITASKSGLGQPWLEAKTSELFSIANYDSNPTDESTMKTMVDQALDLIYPIELPKCNIDFSERKISLRSKCKEAITLRILNDEPFCMIFRWIDIVRNLEARLANSSNDNLSYSLALNAMKLEPIELEKDCQGFSPSAAIACLRNEYSIIIQDVQKKNGDKVVDGGIEKSSEACLVTASGGSSSPSVPGTPVTRDQEQSFDEMVMEEVSAILDRQDLQAVDALDAYANIVSVDITKDAEALFHSTSHEKLGTECEKSSSERGVESSVKEFDDTQIRRIPGKTWEVTVSSGSKAAQVNGKRFDKQALLNHLTTSFLVEMWSCSEDSLVQPCSFSVDERAECQLGLRQSIDCLYLESFADTLLRYSIRHLNPWRCLPTSLPVSDDDNAVLSEMGKTLNVILEALSRFVIDISPSSPVDYVQRLLSFLCDLQAGLSSCAQRIILDGQWVLPPNGILRLMSFPVKSDEMTEQAWTLILRTLTNSARNNVSCTQVIVASQWMEPLVERFLGQCISQFSESTLVGPSLVSAFGDFLRRIHESCSSSVAVSKLLKTYAAVLKREGLFCFTSYPVDMMMEIAHVMGEFVDKYLNTDVSLLAMFSSAVVDFARHFICSHLSHHQYPNSYVPVDAVLIRPDVCFQSMKKTGNESEMDPLLDTTQLPDFSRENAQNYRGDQRTGGNVRFTDRQEASISAFLREVSVYCSKMQSQMADRLLRNHPDVIRNLLSLLSYCTIAHDREVENITLTKWNQVSIADYALHILLLISKYADESMNDLLRLVIETVSRTAHPMVLSKPIAFAIVHMISTPVNQTRFARLGGHLLAARELERSLGALPGGMEDSYSFAPLLRHLASLSAQVSSGTSGWLAPKRPSEVKVDGLYNFAPICAISSTSGLAHQLRTLLAASPPHRRARAANWSYHFYSGEEWLDLTLTLPYQIMLHEVQIRPHAPALNTGPSAIQVELCPDPGFLTWTVLGPPATTTGFSKIRIPTISYPYPVHAVRIHIRKPPDSSNLGLSQIILAGMSTIHGMCISSTTSADMIHWLTILDKVSKLDDYSIWKYAPSLPQALVAFFLSHPLNADAYARISSLLLHLDERAKITTIVELILSHIISGNTVDGEALGWLADLLYSFCVGENERIKSATQSLVHLSHHMHVIRQRQLITGVASLLKKQGKIPKSYERVAAVLLWTAASVIWRNISEKNMRCDTVAICVEVLPDAIKSLCSLAGNEQNEYIETLAHAASWLLASLVRGVPRSIHDILHNLGVVDASFRPVSQPIDCHVASVISKVCQSASAVRHLLQVGLMDYWLQKAIEISKGRAISRVEELISIVSCFASLSVIEVVVEYLDGSSASNLFLPLISFVLHSTTCFGITSAGGRWPLELESATIRLMSRCVSVGGGHRERISNILCTLLKEATSLNGTIQQMVLLTVLNDETITVKLVDDVTESTKLTFDLCDRIQHPVFGCSRRERVVSVSLYSACRHLLPPAALAFNTGQREALREIACGGSSRSFEIRDDSSTVNEKMECSTDDDEKSSMNLIMHLICDAYSDRRPMSGDWTLGQLVDSLRIADRFTHRSGESSFLHGEMKVEDSAFSERRNRLITMNDLTDGYFTLTLKIKASSPQELLRAVEDEFSVADVNCCSPPRISTLQHFARAGGLAVLAQHLQLYQPSPSSNITASTRSWRDRPHGSNIGFSAALCAPSSSDAAYYPLFSCLGDPMSFEEAAVSFAAFDGSSNVPAYEDLEFIDMPSAPQANIDMVPKNLITFPTVGTMQSGGFSANSASNKTTSSRLSRGSTNTLTYGLSPYVVVVFSVLLRLEGYAELLVTFDRQRSKRLLRLAMGVSAIEHGINETKFNQQSTSSNGESTLLGENEAEALALLPFVALDLLYRTHTLDSNAGRAIRDASIHLGVLDILLVCLAHYGHQQHRKEPLRPDSLLPAPDTVSLTENLLRVASQLEMMRIEASNSTSGVGYESRFGNSFSDSDRASQQRNFWAKGTGFGSGTTQQQWNVDLHVMKRRQDEEMVTCLLRVLASFIYPNGLRFHRRLRSRSCRSTRLSESRSDEKTLSPIAELPSSGSLSELYPSVLSLPNDGFESGTLTVPVVCVLSRSCLLPTVCSYLRNDSVLDISRHVDVYEAVINLVAAFALSPSVLSLDGRDQVNVLLSECDSDCSLLSMLKKLYDCISVYLSKLCNGEAVEECDKENLKDGCHRSEEESETDRGREEGLMRLAPLITKTCTILSRRIGSEVTKCEDLPRAIITVEERYIEEMKSIQFETIPFFKEGARIPYHYESSLSSVGHTAAMGKRTRRLAQEIVTLSNSLPLSASSSVFLRTAEERLDVMKVLITGPADTPYMNGCFEFDVWFPSDYPNSPMHVNLETTGNHTVRFNPNLYNDGKVCLSVLNTWHGRPEERWNPETSSFLQVIVSMQSLILVAEPYFNEPGYERSRCTPPGQRASQDYDANIRQATVRWAMLEMIRHPPVAFADVIKKHFWLKKNEIISQITDWIREMETQLDEQRGSARNLHVHLGSLKRHYASIREEFAKMECPDNFKIDVSSCKLEQSASTQTLGGEVISERAVTGQSQPLTSTPNASIAQQPMAVVSPLGSMKVLKL